MIRDRWAISEVILDQKIFQLLGRHDPKTASFANSLESIFFWVFFCLFGVEYFYPPSFQNLFFDICFVSTKKQIIGQCSNIAYHGNGCHFFLRQVINLCASECGFRESAGEKWMSRF